MGKNSESRCILLAKLRWHPNLHCWYGCKMTPAWWRDTCQSWRESSWLALSVPLTSFHLIFQLIWVFLSRILESVFCSSSRQAGDAWELAFSGGGSQTMTLKHWCNTSNGIILRLDPCTITQQDPSGLSSSPLGQQARYNRLSWLDFLPVSLMLPCNSQIGTCSRFLVTRSDLDWWFTLTWMFLSLLSSLKIKNKNTVH